MLRDRARLIPDQQKHLRQLKFGLRSQSMVALVHLAQGGAQALARAVPVDPPQLHASKFIEQGRPRRPRRAAVELLVQDRPRASGLAEQVATLRLVDGATTGFAWRRSRA